MTDIPNFEQTRAYFEQKLAQFGASPRGVDWNSQSAQEVRFGQLARVLPHDTPFSLLDYGSGYGALASYLFERGYPLQDYLGYDISEQMVDQGRAMFASQPQCRFTTHLEQQAPLDYAIASGIFNIKLDSSHETWTAYVLSELNKIDRLAARGFSFNMLTSYSDPEYQRPDLYYADPCFLFDYCKRHFSRNVALLHDYEVYDFTILVRKTPA